MRKNILLLAFAALLAMPSIPSFGATNSKDIKEAASQVSNEPAVGTVQDAMKEFKNLSKKERKDRLKEVKKELSLFKEKKAAGETSTNTLLLVVLALILPPLAVYLHQGEINNKFWISLILTLLFFLPGVIYALIVVLGA
jgi:uncharacterized membrane protein YqaE (UPF0057 family)